MIAAQHTQIKSPGRREAAGALYQYYYLDVAGVVEDFLWLLPLFALLLLPLLCDFVAGAGVEVAVSAAVGAADFGASAAIEAAAKPKLNNAVVIRVADLFMRTPNGGI
jgi:hypothetical protein